MIDLRATKWNNVNGNLLATFEKGTGDPLIFVHGSASDLRTWSAQVDTFAKRYRTIAYSRRYHVPNDPIPTNSADPIQSHVDDLASLVNAQDAAPAHVVGHSWGALVSLLAAQQSPELFRSLVLIEPPAISMHVSVPPKTGQLVSLLFRRPRLAVAIAKFGGRAVGPAEKAFARGNDELAIKSFARGVLGDQFFEDLSEERYAQVWDNRGPDRALALYHGFPDLMGKSFADVRVPVLLICGSASPALFGMLAEGLCERIPQARVQLIEGASHIVHEHAPKEFNSALQDFLSAVG